MWILILTLTASNGGGMAMQDFYSEEACEHAGRTAMEMRTPFHKIQYVCVPQGARIEK